MTTLSGRTALITGASRGLGRATATAFARRGASLAITARDQQALDSLAAELREFGTDVLAVSADLGHPRDIERLVVHTLDHFEHVDILVNNASALGPTPLPHLIDYPPHLFEAVLDVNVLAPFRLTWSLLGGMLRRGSGVVINITSDVAVHGYPGWGAYSVSKAALEGLGRTWASELQATGVRMITLDPGDMDTAMHRAALPEDDPAQLADPITVAEAVAHLAESTTDPGQDRLEAATVLASISSAAASR